MIIPNGYIQPIVSVTGGRDERTGYYVKPTTTYGEKIPCQYVQNNRNDVGTVSGEHFTLSSYTVLLDEQPFPATRVRLLDSDEITIGEYSVQSVELLKAVSQLRITL